MPTEDTRMTESVNDHGRSLPGHDIFKTPENPSFSSANIYTSLDTRLAHRNWIQSFRQGPLLLWVDQLCINQHDLKGRSHQVGFMTDIYQYAESTLACLSTSETDGRGMKWLIDLCDAVPFREEDDRFRYEIEEESDAEDETKPQPMHSMMSLIAPGGIELGSVKNSWLRLMNQTSLLKNKELTVDYTEDRRLCRILEALEQTDLQSQMNHVLEATNLKVRWRGSMDIKALLSYSRSCKASDDRDQVYAILGLASPGYHIVPDYSPEVSTTQLMIMTTRAIVEKEKSLEILLDATAPVKCRNPEMPSWVVDWTSVVTSLDTRNYAVGSVDYCHISCIPYREPEASFESVPDPIRHTPTYIVKIYGIFITKIQLTALTYTFAAFISAQGWRGSGRISIRHCDEVWVLYGLNEPIALRPYRDGYLVVSPVAVRPDVEGFETSVPSMDPDGAERRPITFY
ncbi:hypothetical protein LZL87_013072 [Fusarium oxysporum]|nr:hypothetical protein LZL87_013072 [Fusarium oxysporum]